MGTEEISRKASLISFMILVMAGLALAAAASACGGRQDLSDEGEWETDWPSRDDEWDTPPAGGQEEESISEALSEALTKARNAYIRADYAECVRLLQGRDASGSAAGVLVGCHSKAGNTVEACRIASRHRSNGPLTQFHIGHCR